VFDPWTHKLEWVLDGVAPLGSHHWNQVNVPGGAGTITVTLTFAGRGGRQVRVATTVNRPVGA
jgi:hypothetical protein